MKEGILWNPADAGFGMVWLAKYLLEGNKIATGVEIPGLGAVTVDGQLVKLDKTLYITAENAESLGF